jgi:tetrahydromethanopterin S-methyltransferase subunit G
MNNSQLYLAIGIPTFSVILAWISSRADVKELRAEMNRRFDEVDRRFEMVDRRFEAVDRRFDAMDRRFDAVDAELRYFHGSVGELRGRMDASERH